MHAEQGLKSTSSPPSYTPCTFSENLSLSIATVEQISWPTTPAGYKLQSSTDLGSTKNWTDVTTTPQLGTGMFYIIVPPTQSKVFYRLIKP
jgi:hypothetical protein